ncbi:MAG: hypothetical protein IT377_06770 [Polyangiaceae bacterium]|nr:hypothetical protein [Polyangiaceae bacterium]
MMRRASTLVTLALVVSALLACKKKAPPTDTGATGTGSATPGESPATPPEPAPTPGRFISDLDLARVCNELPMKEAKAYDGATGRIHPTIVFSRKNDTDKFTKSYDSDFDGWKTDEAKDYELVACVTAKSTTKVKECKFDSKTPVHFLDLEDASYEMVVLETQTGKQVAKKSFDLKVDKDCPMIWMFKSERDVKQAEFTQALMGWAKQWVAPKPGGSAGEKADAPATPKPPDLKTPAAVAKSDPKAPATKTPAPATSAKTAPVAGKAPAPAATGKTPAPAATPAAKTPAPPKPK